MAVPRIIGTDGDANAPADRMIGIDALNRRLQGFQYRLGDAAGGGWIGKSRQDNGKLIAA